MMDPVLHHFALWGISLLVFLAGLALWFGFGSIFGPAAASVFFLLAIPVGVCWMIARATNKN